MARKNLTEAGQTETGKPKGFDDFELKLGDMLRGERATLGKSLLDVQRELKINANYIAAIENCDPDAFETPGFIAGFVRSYARYLGLDQDQVFHQFCAESGFATAHGMSAKALPKRAGAAAVTSRSPDSFDDRVFAKSPSAILAPSGNMIDRFDASAIGSIAVLALLVSGLGYGAWSVFREIQQVTTAPVDTAPIVLTDFDIPQSAGEDGSLQVTGVNPDQRPDQLDRIYRPAALDVPILVSRDAPISSLDPNRYGSFVDPVVAQMDTVDPAGIDAALAGVLNETPAIPGPQVVEDPRPALGVIATREAWVQIKSSNGSVLYEKIMKPGEEYVLPQTENAPLLRAGMSGSVYFAVNGDLFGPAGTGSQVAKNVELSVASLMDAYVPADLNSDQNLARMVAELTFESVKPFSAGEQ